MLEMPTSNLRKAVRASKTRAGDSRLQGQSCAKIAYQFRRYTTVCMSPSRKTKSTRLIAAIVFVLCFNKENGIREMDEAIILDLYYY